MPSASPQAGPRDTIYLWGTLTIPIVGSTLHPLNHPGQVSPPLRALVCSSVTQGRQSPAEPLQKVPVAVPVTAHRPAADTVLLLNVEARLMFSAIKLLLGGGQAIKTAQVKVLYRWQSTRKTQVKKQGS